MQVSHYRSFSFLQPTTDPQLTSTILLPYTNHDPHPPVHVFLAPLNLPYHSKPSDSARTTPLYTPIPSKTARHTNLCPLIHPHFQICCHIRTHDPLIHPQSRKHDDIINPCPLIHQLSQKQDDIQTHAPRIHPNFQIHCYIQRLTLQSLSAFPIYYDI